MEDYEIMKMLFLEHHRHLSEIKLKIQGLSQKVIGLLAVATGWIILAKQPPPQELKLVLVSVFLLIGSSTIVALYRFNKNYRIEAKIISKINDYFRCFEKGAFFENESVYPEAWRKFGTESNWYGLSHHIIAIVSIVTLGIVATYFR